MSNASKAPDRILSGGRLAIVMITFVLLITLTGIDQTVLATALVTITSEFNAVSEISWITSTFFIVQACFSLLFGKVLNIAPPKFVLLFSTVIFLTGSLLCAIAPSAQFLIAGRVIGGFGGNGIWVCVLSITGCISTLAMRPMLISLVTCAFGISAIFGPVLGGALTERVSWRWCFYINLPIGGLGAVLLIIFVPNLPTLTVHERSALYTWLKLDWIGALLNIAGVALFLIGLQLGGNIEPWSNASVIVTIIIGVILSVSFIAWEERKGSEAMLPTVMFRRRNVVGSFLLVGLLHWTVILGSLYMPIFYQLRGHSVLRSSIEILPIMGAAIVGGALSSAAISLTGHIWTWLFIPPFLGTVAFALLATSNVNTSLASLGGYQVLIGLSISTIQNAIVLAQAEYVDQEDLVPQVTSLVSFSGLLFSAIGTATAGDIFSGILREQVRKLDLNLSASLQTKVLESIDAVLALPENLRSPLIGAYITAVKRSFITGIVINTLAGLSVLLIEMKNMPTKPSKPTKLRPLSLPRPLSFRAGPAYEYQMLPVRSDTEQWEGN